MWPKWRFVALSPLGHPELQSVQQRSTHLSWGVPLHCSFIETVGWWPAMEPELTEIRREIAEGTSSVSGWS